MNVWGLMFVNKTVSMPMVLMSVPAMLDIEQTLLSKENVMVSHSYLWHVCETCV